MVVVHTRSRRPQGGGLGKLGGSVHQDHDVLDTRGWTTRPLWHRSQRGTGSACHTTVDIEEKKYDIIHPCCMTNFHPHRLMGPEVWLPHLQRWKQATNEAQGAVIYTISDDISNYHYLEVIFDGQASAQLQNCFHAYRGIIVLAGVAHMHANSKLKNYNY